MIMTPGLTEHRGSEAFPGSEDGDPGEALRFERRLDGLLWAVRGEEARQVHVRRCFPWSEPTRWVSLRDEDGNEFALVKDFDDLDGSSRVALEETLVESGFVMKVEQVLDLDEEIEIRTWKVRTEQGERSFQTKLDDWPREVPGGGLIIRDVAGDLYHVAAPENLDRKSRNLLWAFMD
jgi:Domain of unknown function (DUF1854)